MLTLLLPVTRMWTQDLFVAAVAASDIPRERCVLVLDAPGCESWISAMGSLGFSVEVHATGNQPPLSGTGPSARRARQAQMRTFTLPLVGDGRVMCLDDDAIVPRDVYARLSVPGGSVTGVQVSRYGRHVACGVYRRGRPLECGRGVENVDACGHFCLLTDGATYRAAAVAAPGTGQMRPIPGLKVDWDCVCGHMTPDGVFYPSGRQPKEDVK